MQTKICSICHRQLPITDFYYKDKEHKILSSHCKKCHNNFVKMRHLQKQNVIEQIKSELGCAKCGDKRGYIIDFHHKNPEQKSDGISQMLRHNSKKETIIDELQKCIPLCANCHREFHYLNEQSGISIEEYIGDKNKLTIDRNFLEKKFQQWGRSNFCLSEEEENSLVYDYVSNELSCAELGTKYGISTDTARDYLKRNNVFKNHSSLKIKRTNLTTGEVKEYNSLREASEDVQDTITQKSICRKISQALKRDGKVYDSFWQKI